MADYIMQEIEVSSTGSHDYDPEDILVQSYDIDISKCESFFPNLERSPLLPIYSMMYLFHSFSGEEYSDPELAHQEEADQEESEVGLTTLASEPEEIYLLKLLQKSLIKRLSGSEILLMNDYEINHVSGNYDIYVCSVRTSSAYQLSLALVIYTLFFGK